MESELRPRDLQSCRCGHYSKTRVSPNRDDHLIWAYTKSGEYTSKSGYKFLEIAAESLNPTPQIVSPIEKKVWTGLWKTKTSPKLIHFLWRVLSGALAVRTRLRTRGINIDPTCMVCGAAPEDIAHVLFHCSMAKEVWSQSSIPLPPSGSWSNSVFLNLYHLLECSKKNNLAPENVQTFPWILWQIWKTRNEFCFEHTTKDPAVVFEKAIMEAEIWREIQAPSKILDPPTIPASNENVVWIHPPPSWLKCNLASSWLENAVLSGAAWLVRDENGRVVMHSRRAFPCLSSGLDAELNALLWSVESLASHHLDNVIFESSSLDLRRALLQPHHFPQHQVLISLILQRLNGFQAWSVDFVMTLRNLPVLSIANSVTSDKRHQSYVASGGTFWLHNLLQKEALTESMGFYSSAAVRAVS